jgi:ADP-dependent phosphofructokinase/glucokinase
LNEDPSLTASKNPENSVNIPRDIIEALSRAFQSQGLKPEVKTPQLRQALRQGFPLHSDQRGLGGAAAIMAEALTQLGIDARMYSMYHSPEQARCFGQQLNTRWVDISKGRPAYPLACRSGQRKHPTRCTYVLAYPQGLRLRSVNVSAQNTDRCLLILRPFVASQPITSYVVRKGRCPLHSGKPDLPHEWIAEAGFVTWRLKGRNQGQLQIDFASAQEVGLLAREHHYVILNSPGLGQLQDLNERRTAALLDQIRKLSDAGATLHIEMSGGADPQKHNLAPFATSLQGVVRSVGINHKELAQIANISGYPSSVAPTPAPKAPEVYQRYVQALRLAQALELERLYIHGNDVDLILRRGASEAALQQEMHANLFTKGAVIVSILLRNGLNPQTYELPRALYHDGFKALIEWAWQFSRECPLKARDRKALFRQLVNDGYYLAAGRDEYSVVVVPVMWPEAVRLDPSINTTGAGDICSGISLVYSGWR